MRTPSRYIFRLPSHEINPFRATLLLILLICAVLAGVSWLILSFVRTGNTFIFWLTLFIGYLIAIAKQEKIKLIEKRQRLWLINVRDFPFVSSHANFPPTP